MNTLPGFFFCAHADSLGWPTAGMPIPFMYWEKAVWPKRERMKVYSNKKAFTMLCGSSKWVKERNSKKHFVTSLQRAHAESCISNDPAFFKMFIKPNGSKLYVFVLRIASELVDDLQYIIVYVHRPGCINDYFGIGRYMIKC
jgi:hypothetical protein